jgi:DNA-binding MarR family transcriptional regulator
VNGAELFRLGRRLIRLGVSALPPSYFSELPTSVRIVLLDVFENPRATIGQIAARTGFPQSHVSAAVARLREMGVLETEVDPVDRRRTLVEPSKAHIAEIRRAQAELDPVDSRIEAVLDERVGPGGSARLPEVMAALELLSSLLAGPADPSHRSATGGR